MSFNNEVKTLLTVVTPPSLYFNPQGPKIFLAGSIDNGNAIDWQNRAIDFIDKNWRDETITIYNPRRSETYSSEMDNEQMTWTFSMLEASDYILMHLTGTGASPASLLELGLYMKSKKLFISVDDSYTRKNVVLFHNAFYGKNEIYDSLEHSILSLKEIWNNR